MSISRKSTPPRAAANAEDLTPVLEQLIALLGEFPSGPDALNSLKRPGASKDVPLTTTTPDTPIWFKLPCMIEFEGSTDADLAKLNPVAITGGTAITIGASS